MHLSKNASVLRFLHTDIPIIPISLTLESVLYSMRGAWFVFPVWSSLVFMFLFSVDYLSVLKSFIKWLSRYWWMWWNVNGSTRRYHFSYFRCKYLRSHGVWVANTNSPRQQDQNSLRRINSISGCLWEKFMWLREFGGK